MQIVHKVKHRGAGQSALDGGHEWTGGVYVLDDFVPILLAAGQEPVEVHGGVDEREEGHDAADDGHRNPVVRADVVLVGYVGLGGHDDHVARSVGGLEKGGLTNSYWNLFCSYLCLTIAVEVLPLGLPQHTRKTWNIPNMKQKIMGKMSP